MESTASVWEDPHCPFRVEWAPDKLNQMRIAVVDAFYALPRGGIEVGGLLLGAMEGKVIRIDNFAPMECEHLTGPSFVLSAKDEAALEAQLKSVEGQVVGWFHSHTRSEIHLSPQDRAVHDRFFPKAAQVAMVVRPANSQPPLANYFFRGPGGAMTGGAKPFLVEPLRSKSGAAETLPVVSRPVVSQVAAKVVSPKAPIVKPVPATAPVLKPESIALPQPVPVEVKPPAFLQTAQPEKSRSFLWLSIALVLAALGTGAFVTRELWMPK